MVTSCLTVTNNSVPMQLHLMSTSEVLYEIHMIFFSNAATLSVPRACFSTVSVGISTSVNPQQLADLASEVNYNFHVDTFNQLENTFPSIAGTFCDPVST